MLAACMMPTIVFKREKDREHHGEKTEVRFRLRGQLGRRYQRLLRGTMIADLHLWKQLTECSRTSPSPCAWKQRFP